MGQIADIVPYCGAPPTPSALWTRWNLDPILILLLAGSVLLYISMSGRSHIAPWRRLSFMAGWAILTLALISPLCPLSVSLFSARVGQHMILSLLAAPLIVLGRPVAALGFPALCRGWSSTQVAGGATLAFTVAVWFWHAPGPYDATFDSDLIYWLMHVTVIGTALFLWSVLLDGRRERAVTALAAGAFSTLQMTFLGALITLSPHPLYAPHKLTSLAWGLTQQADQQLGGLIMWVPGCTVFLAVTVWVLAQLMSDSPRPPVIA